MQFRSKTAYSLAPSPQSAIVVKFLVDCPSFVFEWAGVELVAVALAATPAAAPGIFPGAASAGRTDGDGADSIFVGGGDRPL